MKSPFFFVVALACLSGSAFAQPTHLDTLRHLNVKNGGGYSAIWGYTAPDGREYALLACNGSSGRPPGTSIIDITVDNNPQEVAFISGPASGWREMKTYKHYAYVVSEAGGGTQIIDLSQLPDTARLVNSFTYVHPDTLTKNTAKAHTISIHGDFMYLNGCANWGSRDQRGMVIFRLSHDPVNPTYAGEYSPLYVHDSYVLDDTIYASAVYSNGGLFIADATNKSNIQTIGKITYSGSGTHNAWVTRDKRYVITTDEIGTTPKTLKIWDRSNLPAIPSAPAATFTATPSDIVHNITIRGDYAYVAWYTAGVRVVNLANPASPLDAGGFDTSTQPPGNYAGVWGVYPYFPSGKIVASDMQNGLWVFRFSDLAPRLPVHLSSPANNDTVRVQNTIQFRWNKTADLNKDPHWYEIHLAGAGGLDTTWRATDSVTSFTNSAVLQNGQQYTWSVTVRDEWNTTASVDTFRFYYATPTSVGQATDVPLAFGLDQNYPNPFNPSTIIDFRLPQSGPASLKVYDILGKEVATIVNENLPAGFYKRTFNAAGLASSVYIYRLQSGGKSEVKRMILVR
ncbi:choice-of-anchor B family protein [Sphingobacteriales bacterium CHB3]|nr:choice-of-anchor B family protein [Sphingobacteriales bacterium CHB3]